MMLEIGFQLISNSASNTPEILGLASQELQDQNERFCGLSSEVGKNCPTVANCLIRRSNF